MRYGVIGFTVAGALLVATTTLLIENRTLQSENRALSDFLHRQQTTTTTALSSLESCRAMVDDRVIVSHGALLDRLHTDIARRRPAFKRAPIERMREVASRVGLNGKDEG